MQFILSDSHLRDDMLPLTFTKHTALLRCGIFTLIEKWEQKLETSVSLHTSKALQDLYPLDISDDIVVINASVLPTKNLCNTLHYLDAGTLLMNHDTWLAIRMNSSDFHAFNHSQKMIGDISHYNEELLFVQYPWDLFRHNDHEIRSDFEYVRNNRPSIRAHESATLIQSQNIFIEEGAEVINASLNATSGPIYIGKNAQVLDGAFIRGPFALCEGATVNMGAKIRDATTVGPYSKVGGEINNTILMGYSNKGHDGFLGNSVIGEWCNLGADTNTSNLKNNYSNVRVWNYRQEKSIDTGLLFCGLIMGDHSKCGINTMFNTGTVTGVSANIFGADFPPKFIPSFSWGGAGGFQTYEFDKALETAKRVMARRGKQPTEQEINILGQIFNQSQPHRD